MAVPPLLLPLFISWNSGVYVVVVWAVVVVVALPVVIVVVGVVAVNAVTAARGVAAHSCFWCRCCCCYGALCLSCRCRMLLSGLVLLPVSLSSLRLLRVVPPLLLLV